MPARNPTKSPTIIAGTNFISGTPNTGQIPYTLGGQMAYSASSGAAGLSGITQVQICVGPGRLDSAQLVGFGNAAPALASGMPIHLVDAAVVTAGVYDPASGHKLLVTLDPKIVFNNRTGLDTFNSGARIFSQEMVFPGAPFSSGLWAVAVASGSPGFTCSYTPVVSN